MRRPYRIALILTTVICAAILAQYAVRQDEAVDTTQPLADQAFAPPAKSPDPGSPAASGSELAPAPSGSPETEIVFEQPLPPPGMDRPRFVELDPTDETDGIIAPSSLEPQPSPAHEADPRRLPIEVFARKDEPEPLPQRDQSNEAAPRTWQPIVNREPPGTVGGDRQAAEPPVPLAATTGGLTGRSVAPARATERMGSPIEALIVRANKGRSMPLKRNARPDSKRLNRNVSQPGVYVVQSGDSLSSISVTKYGSLDRWQDIHTANPHIDPKKLQPGQVIRLPDSRINNRPNPRTVGGETSYTVRPGDTLTRIARRQHGDGSLWANIYAANRVAIGPDPDVLVVGTNLNLPPAAELQR